LETKSLLSSYVHEIIRILNEVVFFAVLVIFLNCFFCRETARVRGCERAAKDISLRLETQDCTTNPEIPPRKAEFPIFYNLRITGLFFQKETYTPIPRADHLITFINGRSFPGVGRFEIDSRLKCHIPSKIVLQSLLCKMFSYDVDNQCLQPTDHPTPQS